MLNQQSKNNFEIFNLGTGNGISVLEMITKFEKITGVKLNYEITLRREGDVMKVYADTTLANEELKWKAELGLSDMIASAWKWEQALDEKLKIKN